MKVKRATPVLFVDSVEATRDFFKRAGFAPAVEVPDGNEVLGRAEVIVERHKTFYNSDELTYQEPGGHLVTFALFA